MPLLLTTFLLAVFSVVIVRLATGKLLSPVLLYWVGWLFGIGAAESLGGDGVMPFLTDGGRRIILSLRIAAAAGFVLGALLYSATLYIGGVRSPAASMRQLVLGRRFVVTGFALQFGVGLISLGYRLAELGGVRALFNLSEIRTAYLRNTFIATQTPPLIRLSAHVNLALAIFPFLFAVQDSLERTIRWRRLLLWWLATMPAGLATGGRGWVVATPIAYGFAYLIAGGGLTIREGIRRWGLQVAIGMVAVVGLFSGMNALRIQEEDLSTRIFEAGEIPRWHDKVPMLKPVVFYMGIPTLAVEEYSQFLGNRQKHLGFLTFPFFAEQLTRFRMIERPYQGDLYRIARDNATLSAYPILGATHYTIAPRLIGDFGFTAYPYVMLLICLVVQFSYLHLHKRGMIARMISLQLLLYGGFWVFQDFELASSGGVLPVFWLSLAVVADRIFRESRLSGARWIALGKRFQIS